MIYINMNTYFLKKQSQKTHDFFIHLDQTQAFFTSYPPVNKHSNGKSPSWMENTSSNGGCSIAMLDYRRVSQQKNSTPTPQRNAPLPGPSPHRWQHHGDRSARRLPQSCGKFHQHVTWGGMWPFRLGMVFLEVTKKNNKFHHPKPSIKVVYLVYVPRWMVKMFIYFM